MKKIIITSLISLMLATNVSADTDGENNLSKKNSGAVKLISEVIKIFFIIL